MALALTPYSTFDLGGLELPNRFVMSPMTRCRAPADGTPDALMALYYSQRASAGLIVSEGTCVLEGGMGTVGVPAVYAPEHVEGWRKVAAAVHGAGGRIFMQLWHTGRVSTAEWQPGGEPPLGPSAIRADARVRSRAGLPGIPDVPREATRSDILYLVDGYAQAARNAIDAGLDGVEIHACNGYLIQQFLSHSANQRTDDYGGSIVNRMRFALQVAEAVAGAVGRHRTGIRLSPLAVHQGAPIADAKQIFPPLVRALSDLDLAYLHCVEGQPGVPMAADVDFDYRDLRHLFAGAWITNNGYDVVRAAQAIEEGDADLVSFGRPFVSNPDFVARAKQGGPFNEVDFETIYMGAGEQGFTDYPILNQDEVA